MNATVFWEKSGDLNSLDFTSCVSPAAQLGIDWNLTPAFLLNLDTRWLWLDTELRDGPEALADISMNVFDIALGAGVRL
jgi:outer membrane protein W